MESCQRKVNSYAIDRSIYLMGLFDWKLVKEEKKENAPSTLYFERDEKVPYYQEMVEIEKEISPKLIPFWVLLIFVGIAFSLITAALIVTMLRLPGLEPIKTFFCFFIPAAIFLFADVVIFYLRSRQLMKYLASEREIVQRAEQKMKELREKYASKN